MRQITLFLFILIFPFLLYSQCETDHHSTNWQDSWSSCQASMSPYPIRGYSHWIEYDFGQVYTLTKTHVWNYNVTDQTGRGFKSVVIDYSIDGVNWTTQGYHTFPEATGLNNYDGFEGPSFESVQARYVLITAYTNWGADCVGISEIKFNLLAPECEKPQGLTAFVSSGNHARISWHIAEGAESYKFWYRQKYGNHDWIEKKPSLSYIELNDLIPNTEYECKVKSMCGPLSSVWSNEMTFTTLWDQCDRPELYNATGVGSFKATISWSSKPNDKKYKVAYKQAGSSEWSYKWTENTSITLTNLEPAKKHKYKVRAKCNSNYWTNWTPKKSFTTYPHNGLEDDVLNRQQSESWDFDIYPNPTTNILNIEYGDINIQQIWISNAVGQQVYQHKKQNLISQIDLEHLPEGIYFFTCLDDDNLRHTKRFVKMKNE